MMLIEITRQDNTKVILNFDHVIALSGTETESSVLLSNGHTWTIAEPLKSLIDRIPEDIIGL